MSKDRKLLVLTNLSIQSHKEEWLETENGNVLVRGIYPHNYPSKSTHELTKVEALRQFALMTSSRESWTVTEEYHWHEYIEEDSNFLTDEQRLLRYNIDQGKNCPYCGSEDLSWDDLNWTGDGASGTVLCNDCNSGWIEEMGRVKLIRIK